ncbi:MAG: type II toxin-antitoxin system HipA family toxin, partial [bacterium]|nr:type II toxin-antitoxin system HipA family toxin [bacterium]
MSTHSSEVLLGDQLAGHLVETAAGAVSFRFHDAYRNRTERPVLGQRFEDDLGRTYRGKKGGLPPHFANLLPEGKLREVIERTAGIETGDDLALLTFVGGDLPGAVVLRSSEVGTGFPDRLRAVATEPEEVEADREGERLRFSLAGIQMKLSMVRDSDKLTLPARGETGEWIVKFDSPTYPKLPENEYSMLEWARAAGFEVPECHLQDASHLDGLPSRYAPAGSQVLAIRRFDRARRRRIHQEDFAQVVGLPPGKKYEHVTYETLVKLTRSIVGDSGAEELVRRLALMIACGNNDAHLKNWSLVYPDGMEARLSPLYDQVSTVAWEDLDRTLALKLAGVKDFGRLDLKAF